MERQGRVEWIDVAKGLGLLLVIIGHTMTTPIRNTVLPCYSIYVGVYFFHMPLMYYLSGRTFGMARQRYEQMENEKFIRKKAWQLLVPYAIYNILVYLLFSIANAVPKLNAILDGAGYGRQNVFSFIKGMLIGDNLYAYHLWFIYGLFVMTLISYLIGKYGKKAAPYILFAIGGIAAFVRIVNTPFYINTTFWGAYNMVMKCYVWFVLGTYCDLSKVVQRWWSIIWQVLSLVYVILVSINFHGWTNHSGALDFECLKWIADAGLIMLFVHVAVLLKGVAKKVFIYTGKNSYGIYLFHQPFFASGGGLILVKVLGVPVWIAVIAALLMCYIFPILVIKWLDTKCGSVFKPYLLGTPRKKRG